MMETPTPGPRSGPPLDTRSRTVLLALILVAGARLLWGLGDKTLWWDESLSLQRAESNWFLLLVGRLEMTDGAEVLYTQDQHPFLFFVLLRGVLALAGVSEYTLRLPAAWAGVLMVPALWALAHRLERRAILPPGTALWAAALAALSPFYLWYGQEARPYMGWVVLAVWSTYLLVSWTEAVLEERPARGPVLAYLASTALLLAIHYHSVLLAVVHAGLAVGAVGRVRPRMAWAVAGLVGLTGIGVAGGMAWVLLQQPGVGDNFASVSLWILARDLLNAFSLGLSVDLAQVWPLDVLFGLLALLGAGWSLRSGRGPLAWIPVAFLLGPTGILFVGNLWQPLYMNARHLAMVSAPFLLLVAGGLAWMARRRPATTALVAGLLLVGIGASTLRYFTEPAYAKGPDLRTLAADLRRELRPGDLLLLEPPFAWRLFRYYLPLAELEEAASQGRTVGWRAVPFIQNGTWSWEATWTALDRWSWMELDGTPEPSPPDAYRRIWLVREGTHPYIDPENQVWRWLRDHLPWVWERNYFSPNSYLKVDAFLTRGPNRVEVPSPARRPPVVFGDLFVLRGWQAGRPLWEGAYTPLTLYWEVLRPPEARYKYILWLEAEYPDGRREIYPRTEQEPFRTFIPTTWWQPGPIIQEETDLVAPFSPEPGVRYWLHVSWYRAETLERLPVSQAGTYRTQEDGTQVVVPIELAP